MSLRILIRDPLRIPASRGSILFSNITAVRLKLEQNQLVDVFGEIGVGVDGLKGA